MMNKHIFFWIIFMLISAFPNASLAQSKYDGEIERGLKTTTAYDKQFKYARTGNKEAMILYKQGTYLIDVTGKSAAKERMEEGIRRLQKSLELDTTFAAPHVSLGNAYWHRGVVRSRADPLSREEREELLDKARAEYRKAVELDPANPIAHFRLAFSSHHSATRIRHFKKALELDPQLDVPAVDRAHIAESEGRLREAFDHLHQRMARIPDVIRCQRVRNSRPAEFGFGYFRKKYPTEYKGFVERVCSGKDLPPFQPYGE